MRIHACLLCGEKGLFLNQERVWVVEDCFCFRKKVCFFLFCSYKKNRLLTWPTDQPRYASYESFIMSNPWHPQNLFLSWLLTFWSLTFTFTLWSLAFTIRLRSAFTPFHSFCYSFTLFFIKLTVFIFIKFL